VKYLIVLFVFVVNGSFAFADSKALRKCAVAYGLTALEEYNSPNEAVISESQAAKDSAFEIMSHMMKPQYAEKARLAFADAEAIALIIQFGDEIEFHYVGVNIVGGQCQVTYGDSVNIADMTGENTGLTPADAPKVFLNYSKEEMIQLLGEDAYIGDTYDWVAESLGY